MQGMDREITGVEPSSSYLKLIHDLATVFLSINPRVDWCAAWTVKSGEGYKTRTIDSSGWLTSELDHLPSSDFLEFVFMCNVESEIEKQPLGVVSPLLDMTTLEWKSINQALKNITESLAKRVTVETYFEKGDKLFLYRERERHKTVNTEWSLDLYKLPIPPHLRPLLYLFLTSLEENGILKKDKIVICEYLSRATFVFLVLRKNDRVESFLRLAQYILKNTSELSLKEMLIALDEMGCLEPVYEYRTHVVIQLIRELADKSQPGRIRKLLIVPREHREKTDNGEHINLIKGLPKPLEYSNANNDPFEVVNLIDGTVESNIQEAAGLDAVRTIEVFLWIEKSSREPPTKEDVLEALRRKGFLKAEGEGYEPSVPDRVWGPLFFDGTVDGNEDINLTECRLDIQFVPLVRRATYKLKCSYLEAMEHLSKDLKIYRCIWCGKPVEKGGGQDPDDIYCSRNCYNRFIERLKNKQVIHSGEASRGRGNKHPKVKAYEEAYIGLREKYGSLARRKFWEQYKPYIGEIPKPYRRKRNF